MQIAAGGILILSARAPRAICGVRWTNQELQPARHPS
jgi:hypothetical protein